MYCKITGIWCIAKLIQIGSARTRIGNMRPMGPIYPTEPLNLACGAGQRDLSGPMPGPDSQEPAESQWGSCIGAVQLPAVPALQPEAGTRVGRSSSKKAVCIYLVLPQLSIGLNLHRCCSQGAGDGEKGQWQGDSFLVTGSSMGFRKALLPPGSCWTEARLFQPMTCKTLLAPVLQQ